MSTQQHPSSARKLHSRLFKTQHSALSTIFVVLCVSAVLLAACQPADQAAQDLPTVAVLPTLEPSDEPTVVPSDTATLEPTIEPSATNTSEPSETPLPSDTLTPSNTPTRIPPPTEVPTATPIIPTFAPPVFSTFTPLPPGQVAPPGTPQQLADVVITRQEFQDAVNKKLVDYPTIQEVLVSFAPAGIRAQLTALGGQAFITGQVLLSIQISNGVAAISPTDITVNAAEPPEAYVNIVNTDFFLLMLDALDTILKERLGAQQDLENIVISGDNMLITLLVPKN